MWVIDSRKTEKAGRDPNLFTRVTDCSCGSLHIFFIYFQGFHVSRFAVLWRLHSHAELLFFWVCFLFFKQASAPPQLWRIPTRGKRQILVSRLVVFVHFASAAKVKVSIRFSHSVSLQRDDTTASSAWLKVSRKLTICFSINECSPKTTAAGTTAKFST